MNKGSNRKRLKIDWETVRVLTDAEAARAAAGAPVGPTTSGNGGGPSKTCASDCNTLCVGVSECGGP